MSESASNADLMKQLSQIADWYFSYDIAKSEYGHLQDNQNSKLSSIFNQARKYPHECCEEKRQELQQLQVSELRKLSVPRLPSSLSLPPQKADLPAGLPTSAKSIVRCLLPGPITLLLAAIYLLLMVLNSNSLFLLSILVGVSMAFSGLCWSICRESSSQLQKWLPQYHKRLQWEEEFNQSINEESMEKFFLECQQYDDELARLNDGLSKKASQAIQQVLDKVSDNAHQCQKKIDLCNQKFNKKAEKYLADIDSYYAKLSGQQVLPECYWHLASDIRFLLTTGRADSFKEALNLALDEKRKSEEEFERQEEARRAEEQQCYLQEQQLRFQQQEAAAQREHNDRMEQLARQQAAMQQQHNNRMAEEARRQAALQAEHNRKMQQQAQQAERQREKAAHAKCSRCANAAKCSWKAKVASDSCAAYRPR